MAGLTLDTNLAPYASGCRATVKRYLVCGSVKPLTTVSVLSRSWLQVAALARRPQLLVATPGRLLDLLDTGAVTLGAPGAIAGKKTGKSTRLAFAVPGQQEIPVVNALRL